MDCIQVVGFKDTFNPPFLSLVLKDNVTVKVFTSLKPVILYVKPDSESVL